jgi:hypothetical protein
VNVNLYKKKIMTRCWLHTFQQLQVDIEYLSEDMREETKLGCRIFLCAHVG